MRKKIDILCHALHGAIAGFTTSILDWLGLAIATFMFIQFTLYETVEQTKVQDELYRELKEWSSGYVVGLIAGLTLKHTLNF